MNPCICIEYNENRNINKRQRTIKGQSKMDNPEKLATYLYTRQRQTDKTTTQYVLDTTMHKQA